MLLGTALASALNPTKLVIICPEKTLGQINGIGQRTFHVRGHSSVT